MSEATEARKAQVRAALKADSNDFFERMSYASLLRAEDAGQHAALQEILSETTLWAGPAEPLPEAMRKIVELRCAQSPHWHVQASWCPLLAVWAHRPCWGDNPGPWLIALASGQHLSLTCTWELAGLRSQILVEDVRPM